MKTVIPFSILLLLVGLLSGCVREETIPGASAGRVFNVSYKVDAPQTRASATGAECEVKDVAVFFYRAAEDSLPNQETYVDCQAVTVPEGSGSSGSFPLPLPPGIIPGMKYKLIVIGNYNKYRPEGMGLKEYANRYNTRTYTKMKQEIQAQLATDGARVTAPLPFYGKLLGKDGNETVLTGPSASAAADLGVSVKFSRAVARVDVKNLAADRLRISWVKVCNYRPRGYLFNETMTAGDIVRGTSAVAPGETLPPGYVQAPPPSAPENGSLQQNLTDGGLYAFYNTISVSVQDDRLTTCLLIAGYYQAPGGPANTTKLTYYRANVSDNAASQVLHRNYLYTVTITNVKQAGADTEEGAMSQKEPLMDYAVGTQWGSGDGSTKPGEDGNFLTLSATSATLYSDAGSTARINVLVKDGASWEVKWKDNAGSYFRAEKTDNNSVSLFTTSKNDTPLNRNATLTVSVTGLSKPLELAVSVTQLSSAADPQVLMVDGKQGEFSYSVPGQGAVISLPVITGSSASQWLAEADNDLLRCISGDYTRVGPNNGTIDLTFIGNPGAARQGTLTVKRLLSDGKTVDTSVAPVTVTFNQGTSPYLVNVLPNYANGLNIDAFQADKGTPNGVSQSYQFVVSLADSVHYKYEATCSFNQKSDAFISKSFGDATRTAAPLQTSKTNPSTLEGTNGDGIWLHVFRTGPGDKAIRGTLEVKAVPKDPSTASQYPEAVYSVPITIKTSCKIGDSKITGTYNSVKTSVLWADRNVTTTPRGDGGQLVGLNYSNDPASDDHANQGFKGAYYTFAKAPEKCATFGVDNRYEGDLATGWRVPTYEEQAVAADRIRFSKQRGYIVSEDKAAGTVGCWFPLSGWDSAPTQVQGYFWSSTPSTNGYYLNVSTGSANSTISTNRSSGLSVRCVR